MPLTLKQVQLKWTYIHLWTYIGICKGCIRHDNKLFCCHFWPQVHRSTLMTQRLCISNVLGVLSVNVTDTSIQIVIEFQSVSGEIQKIFTAK